MISRANQLYFSSASPNMEHLPLQSSLHDSSVLGVIPQAPGSTGSGQGVYRFSETDKARLGKLEMPLVPFQNQEAFLDFIG